MITYRKLSDNEIDCFIEMRINQLREEGAKEERLLFIENKSLFS